MTPWLRVVVVAAVAVALVGVVAGLSTLGRWERVTSDNTRSSSDAEVSAREGELRVHVREAETEQPLIARVVVRALDAATGPRSVASQVVRTLDVRRGEGVLKLPPGRYRVSAGKGVEWSLDAEVVEISSGVVRDVELRPRHVVSSLTLVPCDLHVHAAPSSDSTMTEDDRLLSAASAGIRLMVATDHNVVGDYAPAMSRTDLSGSVAFIHGLEISTSNPAFGHFGVFPYPKSSRVPSYEHTTASAVFAEARRGEPASLVVVHRPHAPDGAGYFGALGFDSSSERIPTEMSTDFDVLEVYSGPDLKDRSKTEEVLRDWFALLNLGKRIVASGSSDSHGNEAPWAGYPRTYVDIGRWKQGYSGGPLDLEATLDALRRGRGFVTSGPTIDFTVSGAIADDPGVNKGLGTVLSVGEADDAHPGSMIRSQGRADAHLRIRAPSWLDVSSIEIVAGGASVYRASLPPRPLSAGKEPGSEKDALERAVRFDSDIAFEIPPLARWIVVLVRGERADEDVLPGVALQPLGFTNPIWVRR